MTPQKPNPAVQGPLQIGQVFIWQYEILQLLGTGGHAFVYRARHRFLGHMVAIKVLHRAAGVSLEMLRRGQAEAQIEFQLKHPGIVSVLDGGIDSDGLLYIVMELLQGRSMRDALIELGKLQVIEVLKLGAKVARAIEVAHRAGVVHRDLKPENLFFTRDGEIKVIDFGIAKIDDAAGWQTQKDMVMGTAYYLSPEQVMAQPVTPRSDIYSLGTIMLEALLGEPPVLRQVGGRPLSFKLLTRIIVTEQLPPLNQVDPRIPAYVDRLLARATAKRAEVRFASMAEFAEACEACARTVEASLVERRVSLTARELWRKTPSASGVEGIGTPTTTIHEHDTAPASRPPFFGGLSSSTATVVPRSKSTAPPSEATPKPVATPNVSPVAPAHSASGEAAPIAPTRPERLSSSAERHAEPEAGSLRPFAALLWGVAAGFVLFGGATAVVLRTKSPSQPATPAVTTKVTAIRAAATAAAASVTLPLPERGDAAELDTQAFRANGAVQPAVPEVSPAREPRPEPVRPPSRSPLSKEPPPTPPVPEGKGTIF
jgi:serine/threonine protein kinase